MESFFLFLQHFRLCGALAACVKPNLFIGPAGKGALPTQPTRNCPTLRSGGGGREVKFPAEDMENDDEYVHVLHKSLVWCKIVFLIIKEKKKTVFFFVFFLKKSRCILLIT